MRMYLQIETQKYLLTHMVQVIEILFPFVEYYYHQVFKLSSIFNSGMSFLQLFCMHAFKGDWFLNWCGILRHLWRSTSINALNIFFYLIRPTWKELRWGVIFNTRKLQMKVKRDALQVSRSCPNA